MDETKLAAAFALLEEARGWAPDRPVWQESEVASASPCEHGDCRRFGGCAAVGRSPQGFPCGVLVTDGLFAGAHNREESMGVGQLCQVGIVGSVGLLALAKQTKLS